MARSVALGEVWLGIEGAALLRSVVDGDDSFVSARLAAIRALVGQGGEGAFALRAPVPEAYLRAFREAGLEVLECVEAPMEADFTQGLTGGAPEAAEALWRDLPAALVWTLERR